MRLASSRGAHAAALVGAFALLAAGCGKADLASTSASTPAPAVTAKATAPAPKAAVVPVPLPLTPERSEAFARAVQLTKADVPGAHEATRSKPPLAREREAANCGGRSTPTVGGARSPEL